VTPSRPPREAMGETLGDEGAGSPDEVDSLMPRL
jgi:hypothetical protein